VQLRRRDISGLAGFGDDLTALDHLVALDQNFACVGISGDKTVGVTDQRRLP
jgi:hypothetical protein